MVRSISSRGQQPSEKFLHIFRTRNIGIERDKEKKGIWPWLAV
jgi:hypothetical protein